MSLYFVFFKLTQSIFKYLFNFGNADPVLTSGVLPASGGGA